MPRFQPGRKRRRGGTVATWRPGSGGGGGGGVPGRVMPGGVTGRSAVPARPPNAKRAASGSSSANVPAAVDAVGLGPQLLGHGAVMLATAMPDSSPLPAVGVDLGGTTIKAALVAPIASRSSARSAVPTDLRSQGVLLERDRAAGRNR